MFTEAHLYKPCEDNALHNEIVVFALKNEHIKHSLGTRANRNEVN